MKKTFALSALAALLGGTAQVAAQVAAPAPVLPFDLPGWAEATVAVATRDVPEAIILVSDDDDDDDD